MIDCSVFEDDRTKSACYVMKARREQDSKPVYDINNNYQQEIHNYLLNTNYDQQIRHTPEWVTNFNERLNDKNSNANSSTNSTLSETWRTIGISIGVVVILLIISFLIKCSKRNNRGSNSRSNLSTLPGSSQTPQVGISGHTHNSVSVPIPLTVPSAPVPPFVQSSAPSNDYLNQQEQHCAINYEWKRLRNISDIPPNAVLGGHDSQNRTYVGRGEHLGIWYPANIVPTKGAVISVDFHERRVENVEVLCTEKSSSWWVSASDGDVPPMALEVITNSSVEMYIGRVNYQGKIITGVVLPSKKCILVSVGGQQILLPSYDVLVDTAQACRWVSWIDRTNIPVNAVESGVDYENNKMYIGRSHHNGNIYLAKINPVTLSSFISLGNAEFHTDNAEILVENKLCWLPKPTDNSVPSGAIVTSSKIGDQDVYIGCAQYFDSTYVGRIDPTNQCIYIPYRGSEVSLSDYEYLVQP